MSSRGRTAWEIAVERYKVGRVVSVHRKQKKKTNPLFFFFFKLGFLLFVSWEIFNVFREKRVKKAQSCVRVSRGNAPILI